MSGFLGNSFKIKPWLRRLITRVFAIVPAMVVASTSGEDGLSKLLVLSQVILSLQLPFAIWPLIYFTSNSKIMTIDCVKYIKGSSSSDSVDEYTLNEETEETIDFSNGKILTTLVVLLGTLLTGLNIFLLTQINTAFSEE